MRLRWAFGGAGMRGRRRIRGRRRRRRRRRRWIGRVAGTWGRCFCSCFMGFMMVSPSFSPASHISHHPHRPLTHSPSRISRLANDRLLAPRRPHQQRPQARQPGPLLQGGPVGRRGHHFSHRRAQGALYERVRVLLGPAGGEPAVGGAGGVEEGEGYGADGGGFGVYG